MRLRAAAVDRVGDGVRPGDRELTAVELAMYRSAHQRLLDTAIAHPARVVGEEIVEPPELLRGEQEYDAIMDRIPAWTEARRAARGREAA
jgi:hypothetical protein